MRFNKAQERAAHIILRPCFGIYRFHFAACHPHAIPTVELVSFHIETACHKFHIDYMTYFIAHRIFTISKKNQPASQKIDSRNVHNPIRQ